MRAAETAPISRTVCQFTGARDAAPSAFFRALDRLSARDDAVCDEADAAADGDDLSAGWLAEARPGLGADGCGEVASAATAPTSPLPKRVSQLQKES